MKKNKKKHLYVAMVLLPWSDWHSPELPFPIKVDAGGSVGYLPVFDSIQKLQKRHPGVRYQEIEPV